MALIFILCIVFGVASVYVYAQPQTTESNNDSTYEIDSLKELKQKANVKGDLTKEEQKEIIEETAPEVIKEYVDYVDEKADEIVENSEPEVICSENGDVVKEVYEADIDDLSSFKLVLEDRPEENLVEEVCSAISGAIIDTANAASNGEEKWKKVGNRYFTAKYTRYIYTGYAVMCTENHYTVTKDYKIKERYGTSWADMWSGLVAYLYDCGHSIEDKWANKVGEDAHIKAHFTVQYKAKGVNEYCTFYERTKIKLLKIDKSNKRVKVKHSWSKA